jgi:hypothetical protein
VFIVGAVSFGLGRLSVEVSSLVPPDINIRQQESKTVYISEPKTVPEREEVDTGNSGTVVASKTGSKYHLPNCPGASQIKPENRITFTSESAAEAAGYTPAANCPGLR